MSTHVLPQSEIFYTPSRSTLDPTERPVSFPFLTPEQVAQHVVDRRYRFTTAETIAVGELLVSMYPDSIREAEEVEVRLILLDIFREDPAEQFERLTGT